jgi:nitroreductase
MDTYQTIMSLRTVRQFDRSKPIVAESLQRILQAGRMSGSSKDSQPWWFIVITERDTLLALSDRRLRTASGRRQLALRCV